MVSLTVLGSGGNSPIPTPTCDCRVCQRARTEGIPHARHGNSLYLEELDAVVDAPEFIYENLEREAVDTLEYVFLTHWHPDHTAGLRVVQSRSMERMFADSDHGLVETARSSRPTLVTTRHVYDRTCEVYDGLRHYVEDVGFADVHFLDEEPLTIDDARIQSVPYSLSGDSQTDATGFVIEQNGTTIVLVTDDARYLEEDRLPEEIDLAVFECGYFPEMPDGTQILTDVDETIMGKELTHAEVLDRIGRVAPRQTLLTEIEHLYGRTYTDYCELEQAYESIQFAYDGLTITL